MRKWGQKKWWNFFLSQNAKLIDLLFYSLPKQLLASYWFRNKQWPLAPNSRKWQITHANVSNASLIFQKWPLANVGKSGKSVTAFWRIWRILKLGRFMYKQKIFLGIKRSSLPLPNLPNPPNLLNLLNTCQICQRESQKFGWLLVFANLRTHQKRQTFGEYSNLLNLPASGHCLFRNPYLMNGYLKKLIDSL